MSNAIEIKFDKLRADYLATMAKLTEQRSAMASKYGPNYLNARLRPTEITKLAKLEDAAEKRSVAFTEHLKSFSPRDWSYGVPGYWVREDLTFADAVRPIDEPLSVVPPLSYGGESMKCTNKTTTAYIRSRNNMSPVIELAYCGTHDPGAALAKARFDSGDATTTYIDGAKIDGIPTWPHRACDHK